MGHRIDDCFGEKERERERRRGRSASYLGAPRSRPHLKQWASTFQAAAAAAVGVLLLL